MQLDEKPEVPTAAIRAAASAWGMKFQVAVAGFYGLAQGICIIFSGDGRFSAPGYTIARELPGSPLSIGLSVLLTGIVTLVGLRLRKDLVVELGMLATAVWSLVFGTTFLLSSLRDPNANTTAFLTYLFVAVLVIVPAAVSHSSHPNRRHQHG